MTNIFGIPHQPATPTSCPHIVPVESRSGRDITAKRARCTNPPQPNGWCAEHQAGQQCMQVGESVGWQEVQVNESLTILTGKANWECFAELVTAERVKQVKRTVARCAD